MTQEIREWFHKSNIGKPQGRLLYSIREWTKKAKESKMKSFESVAKMIEKHEQDFLRYFISGQTNAKAENLNSRIQRLLASNYGTKDRDFFFYRTQIYFALAPQKKLA